ncbi:FAD-binding oxidoreductase [Streptomyces liangshanensis]|uniref:FAD-binding oxidoreductase n=1 Tax=Streptomyces liangshanensis TaxID=2717324 RepID=UPI001FB93AF6|nr:FAD-binding oxidoreductase [Streptomyces liangshanensis]
MTVPASTPDPSPGLPAEDIAALRAAVAGEVFRPGDAGYAHECATFNLAVPQRPAVAVGAARPADVQAAVAFASAHGLPAAVLSTGHQSMVPSDGALLITTGRMSDVTLGRDARTAVVRAGARAQQVMDAAAPFGVTPTVGSSPTVGVVGFTLGGGLSPTFGRPFGWAADYVRAIDVVTADGRLRHTTADEEPDLFWALRGSRSNMGVVTALEVELHDVTRLYGGGLFFRGEDTEAVLRAYLRLTATAPEELTSSIALLRLPDVPAVPDVLRGGFMVHVRIAYLGTPAEGADLLLPLRQAATPVRDTVGDMPLTDFASIHLDPVDPMFFREWTAMLAEFPPEAADVMTALAGPGAEHPVEFVELRHLGGALGRRNGPPSAVGNRDAAFALWIMSMGPPAEGDPQTAYAERVLAGLEPWSTGHTYLNFSSSEPTAARVKEGYGPETYARLRAVKAAYDPENLFRLNQNVPPEVTSAAGRERPASP